MRHQLTSSSNPGIDPQPGSLRPPRGLGHPSLPTGSFDHVGSAGAPVGTGDALAVGHRLPEDPEVALAGALAARQRVALPGCGSSPEPVRGPMAQQRLLPATKSLSQLLALPGATRRVRAEPERAPVRATRSWVAHTWPGNAEVGPHCGAVADEARWKAVLVRSTEIPLVLVGLAPFGQVEQQQHVGDELLGTTVQRGPACRGRDPQVVHPRLAWIARVRSNFADHARLVNPQVPLRAAGHQRLNGELRRTPNQRMQPVAPGISATRRD